MEAPSLALPALFAIEYALAMLVQSWGLLPVALIGHSAGEFAAACISGVFSMPDAISLVALRGCCLKLPAVPCCRSRCRGTGAVATGSELSLAAVNGPSLCVASGPIAAIGRARSPSSVRMRSSMRAFASTSPPSWSMLELSVGVRTLFQADRFPKAEDSVCVQPYRYLDHGGAMDPAYWVRHLRNTVRFDQGARTCWRLEAAR